MIGQRFTNLVVVKQVESYIFHQRKGQTGARKRYECLCDCGLFTVKLGIQLRNGKAKRCPTCAYKLRPQSTQRISCSHRLMNLTSRVAEHRYINWELTLTEYENLIFQNCYYCGSAPKLITHLLKNKHAKREPFYANGIDRIDTHGPYSVSNTVACCKDCNYAKSTQTQLEFMNLIKRIYEFNHLDKDFDDRYKEFIKEKK